MLCKKTGVISLIALVAVLMLLLTGCTSSPEGTAPVEGEGEDVLKVAFVYNSPADDGGYSQAQDVGRQYLEKNASGVETTYVENIQPGGDCERIMSQLIQNGYKVIFGAEFGFMDTMLKLAKEHPDVTFLHAAGYQTAGNLDTYYWRAYQARYLTGMLAGKLTESNIIGYTAAHPIPVVIRGINAFTLGVRAVNPDAEVRVVWTNSWYDPATEKEAADSLLDTGADIITTHLGSQAPIQAAAAKGKYSFGYDCDRSEYAPDYVITSIECNWGPYFVEEIQRIKDGTWQPREYWGGMAEGIVELSPYGPMVTEEMAEMVEAQRQLIISGSWDVFTGPIVDQEGNLRVKEGESLTDEEMLSMDWFVEGVSGTIPK